MDYKIKFIKKNKLNNLTKGNCYKNEIIFIDGLWGTGKSLLSPIISGMNLVEKVRVEIFYEQIGILLSLNKITEDAAKILIQNRADNNLYDGILGREVNFRLFDDTGVFNNPNPFRYIKRQFIKDVNIQNTFNEKIALSLMGHMNILNLDILIESFGERLKFIEVVRHPVYMFNHWVSYLERFSDPKIFIISNFYKNSKIPWFAFDWAKEYVSLNIYDRTLKSIIYTSNLMLKIIKKNKLKNDLFLAVSFESLVFDTEKELKKLEIFLGRKYPHNIKTLLKKQRIPRKTLSSGLGKAKYSWNEGSLDEEKDYRKKWNFIKLNCNTDLVNEFKTLINKYNRFFPSKLKSYE